MVEKIIVNPESVRGWGNVVMEHTVDDYTLVGSSILVDSDTVMGVESVVYTIEAEDTTISVVLVSSVASCSIGDSVVLTATVTEDSEAVEGGTVTFKLGSSTLGTDETDSSGVATYTVVTSDVGSLNFTAFYESHNSNTVSVVVSHDYSIAFSQSSYTASGGSATLELTLLDNSSPVSGATISVSGSDGSLYSCLTDNNGVAEVTVSVSADTTFTASYSNVSDTCTVTVPTYLFYDDCSSSTGLSNYGSSIAIRNNGTSTLTFDSTNDCYKLTNTRGSSESLLPIDALQGTTDSFKFTVKGASWGNTLGLMIYFDSNNFYRLVVADSYAIWESKKVNGTYSEAEHPQSSSYLNQNIIVEVIVDNINNLMTLHMYDGNGTYVNSLSQSIPTLTSTVKYGFSSTWNNNAYSLITEIKAEYL